MRRFGKAMAALAVAACMMFGGAATANADEDWYDGDLGSTKVGTPTVSDVGAHTANVSFDYQIDPSILPKVQSVCFAVEVMRVTSIKPINDPQFGGNPAYSSLSCSGGTSDGDLTSDSYQSIFGTKTWPVKLGEEVQSYATGQWFERYDTDKWNHAASGTVQVPVIGLQSNTTYGNTDRWGDYTEPSWNLLVESGEVCKLADPTGASLACSNAYDQPVDVRSLYAGMRVVLKDGSAINFGQTAKPVSDFTTKAEPVAKPAEALPSKTDVKLEVSSGKIEPGKTARVYVDNLKAEAKGKADASSLFWYAYVYSSPQRMTGPDGSPYVTVEKDPKGRYYFDAIVPAGLEAGSHTVSLVDAAGACQGWAPVTVTASDTVTMWRLYNPNSGEHFYTGNTAERDHLVHVGWKSEGTGWTAPVSGDPVYRLYNPNAGDHHYTLNPAERDMLVRAGWKSEGIGWYSAAASVTGRKPLYRQYNPNARAGAHNYTLSRAENDHLVRVGWRAEGLAWYAVS